MDKQTKQNAILLTEVMGVEETKAYSLGDTVIKLSRKWRDGFMEAYVYDDMIILETLSSPLQDMLKVKAAPEIVAAIVRLWLEEGSS